MDIGGFRDMHRHRRCVQLIQHYTDLHGYEEPVCPGQPTLAEAGLAETYASAMEAAHTAYRNFRATTNPGAPRLASETWDRTTTNSPENTEAAYLLPLGTRIRAMFKMDFAESLYIAELRSGAAGHFSYRRVAWEMYLAVASRHPALAPYFRIEDVNAPIDLLKR
jgi:thymidylate synthase ThyX